MAEGHLSLLTSVENQGGELSSGAYQAAINACARAEPPAWRAALEMLERCRAAKGGSLATAKVWGSAIHACRSEWLTALELLQQMTQRDGHAINQFAATAAIKALGDAGEWRKALTIFLEVAGQQRLADGGREPLSGPSASRGGDEGGGGSGAASMVSVSARMLMAMHARHALF